LSSIEHSFRPCKNIIQDIYIHKNKKSKIDIAPYIVVYVLLMIYII